MKVIKAICTSQECSTPFTVWRETLIEENKMPKSRQTITLPNTYVGAQPNFIYAPSNGGYHADFHGMSKTDLQQITAGLAFHNLRGRIIASLNLLQNKIDTLYANFSIPTDTLVEQDLSAAGLTRSES